MDKQSLKAGIQKLQQEANEFSKIYPNAKFPELANKIAAEILVDLSENKDKELELDEKYKNVIHSMNILKYIEWDSLSKEYKWSPNMKVFVKELVLKIITILQTDALWNILHSEDIVESLRYKDKQEKFYIKFIELKEKVEKLKEPSKIFKEIKEDDLEDLKNIEDFVSVIEQKYIVPWFDNLQGNEIEVLKKLLMIMSDEPKTATILKNIFTSSK